MESKYCPPYKVLMMPFNKDGDGPEMDPAKIVKTVWQVWDAANQTVSSHGDEPNALAMCASLNIPHPGVEGPELTDLLQVPKVAKRAREVARNQILQRYARRRKLNHTPARRKQLKVAMAEHNSLKDQRERNKRQVSTSPKEQAVKCLPQPSGDSQDSSISSPLIPVAFSQVSATQPVT